MTTLIVASGGGDSPARSGARRRRPRASRTSSTAVAAPCAQVNGDARMTAIVPHGRLASQSKERGVDLNDTPEQATYRAKVRAWLERHRDEAPVFVGHDEQAAIAARRAWQGVLAKAGLAGVTWPVELGGQGLGPVEQVILNQEILRAGVPGILDVIGIGMLGPTIIAHGTDEQRNRYLGPLLHGDEVWCQLFSEPAAGSDLAAVQARATAQPDGTWRLTGQKVWTTNAHFASFGMLLARTDPDVPKHKGLTMFVVPMDAAGVTVRPLRKLSGEPEFNEVFFDDVALEADAVVGPVGGGWGTALTTLMFERMAIGLGSEAMGFRAERFAAAIAGDEDAAADPEVRRRLGEVAVELLAVKFTGLRTLSALQQGQIPGPESGLAKITTVSAAILAGDLIADVLGPDALDVSSEWEHLTSYLPGLKSAGGTEEILRNTVGERVLGLPPEPRLDKGIPFSELRAKERAAVGS
jgi:alkylation response protein AidB-like acyl-CoA dehydrogenase